MEYPELKLKNDVVTRWNSTYDMLERITKIKEPLLSAIAVTNFTQTLTSQDFKIFDWCCKILKPFKDVTEELSAEKGVTVSKVILFSRLLLIHISKIESDLKLRNSSQSPIEIEVYNMCVKISRELLNRFQNTEDNIIWADSTDPRFKKYGFKKESAYKNAYDRILRKITALISRKQRKNQEDILLNPPASVSKFNEKTNDLRSDFDSEV